MASVTRGRTAHRTKRAAAAARILEATERLLRSGERFTEISVERLLTEADVSRSTFYVHFADKSALLIAVADQAMGELMQAADRWWAGDHSSRPDDAEATVLELIKIYRKHAPLFRTLAEVGAYDDPVADVWRAKRQRYSDITSDRVRREQSQGFVSPDVDVTMAANAVAQLVDVTILEHVAHGSPRKDKQLAHTIARIGWLTYYGQVPER